MNKTLKNKLDRVFSEYIRKRDSRDGYFTCISCGRIKPYEQADCGHYINRVHLATRWSEENCNAECRHCNRFDENHLHGYRMNLVKKIGESRVLMLESRKNSQCKIGDFELKYLIDEYQRKIKEM